MKSLIKTNNQNRDVIFPEFPSLFDDFLTRDFFNYPSRRFSGINTLPAVNVKETETAYELEMAAPGIEKKDFKIEIENNILFVSAEKIENTEEKKPEANYSRKEFSYRSFKRAFNIPENSVNIDEISAGYKDGILHVNLPKKEVNKKQSVKEIQVI